MYSDEIYVSSNEGLFVSNNSILWEKLTLPSYTYYEAVYDAEFMHIFNDTWIGSSPLLIMDNDSFIYESITANENIHDDFYAYPNPFFNERDINNTSEDVITFVYKGDENNINGTITVYDFSLDRVVELSSTGFTQWNGRNEYGEKVANGIYVCQYEHSDKSFSSFNLSSIASNWFIIWGSL